MLRRQREYVSSASARVSQARPLYADHTEANDLLVTDPIAEPRPLMIRCSGSGGASLLWLVAGAASGNVRLP
jgi:hypothetical protein